MSESFIDFYNKALSLGYIQLNKDPLNVEKLKGSEIFFFVKEDYFDSVKYTDDITSDEIVLNCINGIPKIFRINFSYSNTILNDNFDIINNKTDQVLFHLYKEPNYYEDEIFLDEPILNKNWYGIHPNNIIRAYKIILEKKYILEDVIDVKNSILKFKKSDELR